VDDVSGDDGTGPFPGDHPDGAGQLWRRRVTSQADFNRVLDLAMRHLAAAFTAPEHPATPAAPAVEPEP
jgi:hypothetical protein